METNIPTKTHEIFIGEIRDIKFEIKCEINPNGERKIITWLYCSHVLLEFPNDEYYQLKKDIEDMINPTYEMCPHCDNEVVLEDIFGVQECPICNKEILPCSICTHIVEGQTERYMSCAQCPLEKFKNNS